MTNKPKPKNHFSNRKDVAESRVSFGNSSALALRLALMRCAQANEVLWGLYERVSACALRSNHWVGEDLHNEETGELYEGNGIFWGCGSRLCPSCVAKLSRRSRRQLRLALEEQKLYVGENYQFITLTMPNPGLPLLRTRAIMDRAWSLFRKRDFFKEKIRGGSKSEEFTVTENGYHYHFHLLCVSRFLSYDRLRQEWTDCLSKAFGKYDLSCELQTSDGLAMVRVERVSGRRNIENAVLEVCKYITKNDSWEKIPPDDLIEIASIKRFPRMFELFGCFRENRKESTNSAEKTASDNDFSTKNNEIHDESTILDTKQISDGEDSAPDEFSGSSPPEDIPKRRRKDNWRVFIEKFGIGDYIERLTNELHRAWECRRYALKKHYPFAQFSTLDGLSF